MSSRAGNPFVGAEYFNLGIESLQRLVAAVMVGVVVRAKDSVETRLLFNDPMGGHSMIYRINQNRLDRIIWLDEIHIIVG